MSNACLLYGFLGTHEGSEKLVDQGLRALISAMGVPINEVGTQIGRKTREDGTQIGPRGTQDGQPDFQSI